MNYLAHAYLSFHHPEILVGNMISDFVKGKKKYEYPEMIQKGIRLHRAIDHFTDTHEATRMAKQLFKPAVGLYAGAFVDVVYDHFLAKREEAFTEKSLPDFADWVYTELGKQQAYLPEKFAGMLPYMQTQNWLYNYRQNEGIRRSFGGLVRRAAYLEDPLPAYQLFTEHYDKLAGAFSEFFPDVQSFALTQFNVLLMH